MLWKLLVQYSKPYRGLLLAVVLFQLIQSVASLYLPSLNADIIDDGVAKGDTGFILSTGGLMLAITLVQVAASITAVYFGARLAMSIGRDLRRAVFRRVGDFSEQEVQRFGAPSLITRSTNDVQQVQMLVLMSCTMLVSAPILAIGGIVFALREDLVLSWIMVVAVPVMLGAVGLIVVRMVPLFRSMQTRIDQVNRVMREQLTGIRVIRAFVREPVEQARFDDANAALTKTALDAGRLFALVFPIVMLVLNVSSVAVLWFGAFRVDSGEMQIGALTAFLSYLLQILMAIMMATFMAIMIPRAAVSGVRIKEVLDTDSSVVLPEEAVDRLAEPGAIEFDRVTFSYPGAESPVLHEISFVAEPGRTTAIIGATGAGKTTIIGLAARLFDASEGTVKIGGTDVRDLGEAALYDQLALVPQKPYLFAGTVASTLRYGNPEASDAQLRTALEIAQAIDFVDAMPGGLESPIAQGGTNVSGGQRQRLSIARALVKDPPILLFDDSFSALDTATDARLRDALQTRVPGVTKLIVAQRVATIIDADQILVVENGRITGRGTHDELLETSEAYAEIVASQLSAEEAA
ncbi:ABC transporter ATP-binding protein [Agromyces seonyuensis]|uniref:ATP-binding cassette domain-containing protein n=1 Tax=Agromyces seonyuensis TaxID=2662446 RepID=A0A6I4P4S8_9MICO|nr:ABC transporter ATP-binding protein [Agromyces seonyuensis]MWB98354.1 ATP-binding cassette domain-containing protein [Agromyces seonyuensis]